LEALLRSAVVCMGSGGFFFLAALGAHAEVGTVTQFLVEFQATVGVDIPLLTAQQQNVKLSPTALRSQ